MSGNESYTDLSHVSEVTHVDSQAGDSSGGNAINLEKILDRDEAVVAIHSADIDAMLVQFRLLSRRTGRSIYHWSEAQGMSSLKAADIVVPGSRKLVEALRYVVQSIHYGIYVFTHFDRQMRPGAAEYLRRIAMESEDRKVVLIAQTIRLPAAISEHVYHVFDSDRDKLSVRPKLRDGRWVV